MKIPASSTVIGPGAIPLMRIFEARLPMIIVKNNSTYALSIYSMIQLINPAVYNQIEFYDDPLLIFVEIFVGMVLLET